MVHILLEGFDIAAPWLFDDLRPYLRPEHKVAIVAFSFRDSRVKNALDWDALYHPDTGCYYGGMVGGFLAYGIPEENIRWINYFTHSKEKAAQIISEADIVYFPGGLPDRMMERINEFDLRDVLLRHQGVVMGYSAGAVIQMAQYHLSPDEDYPEFAYYEGLPWLRGFYLEVHYENTPDQNRAIARVLREKGQTVYATALGRGALLIDSGQLRLLGDVKVFTP